MLPQIKHNSRAGDSTPQPIGLSTITSRRSKTESNNVLLANHKNSLYLLKDPNKIPNQSTNYSFKFLTPKTEKIRNTSHIITERIAKHTKRLLQDHHSIETQRKRMIISKCSINAIWKINNRTNNFTNEFMGQMFEDTTMDKEYTKKISNERARIKMEIEESKRQQYMHEEMK